MNCRSLVNIDMNRANSTINPYCFYNCEKLELDLSNATRFESYSCYNSGIKVLKPLKLVGYMAESAFENCVKLEEVVIEGPTTTAERAFKGCTSLKTYTAVGTTYNYLRDEVFMNCTALESFKIDSTLGWIGKRAFMNCISLKEISSEKFAYNYSFGHTNNNIQESTFENCVSLKSIVITSTVRNIDKNAFKGCTSITNLEIPGVVEGILPEAFAGWTSAQTITFNRAVPASRFIGGWDRGCDAKIVFNA